MSETTTSDRRFEGTCGYRWTDRDGERHTCGIRVTGDGTGTWRHDARPDLPHTARPTGTVSEI